MYYAKDCMGNTVCIEDSSSEQKYFCPACGGEMRRKMGKIKQHHFAHLTAECDPWYSENKGLWHRHMQSLFPAEYQEVAGEIDGERHIADVFIPTYESAIIIEFQHSPLSVDEYKARNEFWSNFGTVIWVFDVSEKDIRQIPKHKGIYKWYRPATSRNYQDCQTYTWFYMQPVVSTYYSDGTIYGYESQKPFFVLDDEGFNYMYTEKGEYIMWDTMFEKWELKHLGALSEASIIQTTEKCNTESAFIQWIYELYQNFCQSELEGCLREYGYTCWVRYKNKAEYMRHASAWASISEKPTDKDTLVRIYLEEESQVQTLNVPQNTWNICIPDIARIFSEKICR